MRMNSSDALVAGLACGALLVRAGLIFGGGDYSFPREVVQEGAKGSEEESYPHAFLFSIFYVGHLHV
jgi:hypothetical protein